MTEGEVLQLRFLMVFCIFNLVLKMVRATRYRSLPRPWLVVGGD